MTETPDPHRERAHRLAETFADDGDVTVVALLADAAEPGASWSAAAALAGAAAARRRTLLVNLAGAGSGLDGFLEVEGREGLEAVRSGERKLSEAAVDPPGRDFLYLPAGDPGTADRGRPTEDPDLLRALRRLADKIGEARGLLLLYLEAGALPQALAGDLVDGAVPLAGADPHLPESVPLLGRLGAPEEEAPPEETPPEEAASEEAAPDEEGDEDFLPGVSGAEAAGFGAGAGGDAPPEEPEAPEGPGLPGRDGGDAPGDIEMPEPPEPEATEEGPEPPAGRASAPGEDPDDELEDAFVHPEPPDGGSGEEPDEGPDADEGDAREVPEPAGAGAEAPSDGGGAPPDGDDGRETDAGDGDDGSWRRHRRSAGPPWAKIAAGVAAVLLLGVGWWWFAGRAADAGGEASGGTPDASREAVAAADSPAASEEAPVQDGDTAVAAGEAGDGAGASDPSADAVASAPELTHSVLVASYSDWPAARDRAEELRSGRGGTWVVAPTPVRGTMYWRLFAGALPDAASARTLMEELVRGGVKDEARDWDVRPASLAWRLGVETDRSEAASRAADLRDRGIPAYLLPAAAGADTAWQVYAGAYESREAAGRLGGMLEEVGVEGSLVTRRGERSGR